MKNKIKVYRAMRNITQEELADQLRVTRRTINSIEGGKYNPSIEVAFRMAKLFNVPVEELFSLDDGE
jgi:putative transcriptional regulator